VVFVDSSLVDCMVANVRVGCRCLLFVSLLFVFVLLVSLFSCVLVVGVENVSSSEEIVMHVKSDRELYNAVRNAPNGTSVVIVLDNDIVLTEGGLGIPTNKDITLTSNDKENVFYQLICAKSTCTIFVWPDGVLRLDGVIVTHAEGYMDRGIWVYLGGTFIMYDGKIVGNTNPDAYVSVSTRSGFGGGVENRGTFVMFGGEISGNVAGNDGGGVFNEVDGIFTMYGGKISNNTAKRYGGGVSGGGFEMFDGEISGNTAGESGGGVATSVFTMHNGLITGNTAEQYGGGVFATVNKFGGTISGNKAQKGSNIFPPLNSTVGGYSLRSIMAICAGVIGIMVVVLLFRYFKSHKTSVHRRNRKNVSKSICF